MRARRIISLLSVALVAAAAVGPPAAAAPGEGGGAVAGSGGSGASAGSGGGTAYGVDAPAPKRHRRRARRASDSGHRFPIAGSFDWGGPGARFGARRRGHRHQGQDLPAALGTPVVSPHAGVVEAVEYQARAAGNYVVIDSDGEAYDFVFMHLRTGSVRAVVGRHVRAGQRVGEVGSTGESSGPHLHFEIWVDGWYVGGHPIDPLPLLEAWAGS